MMSDETTYRQLLEERGLRDFEIFALQRHAHFPKGTKRDPASMQSRVKLSRQQIERWDAAMARVKAELADA